MKPITPLIVGSLFIILQPAAKVVAQVTDPLEATDNKNLLLSSEDTLGQVTSVSQLSDVQPSDWAYQAVKSLIERYGVISGYPDGTFKGNRFLTRDEFAVVLDAALAKIQQLQATGKNVEQNDLPTIVRLQNDFQSELANLRGRVSNLEDRTTQLEHNQVSTKVKLSGEAIINIGGVSGDTKAVPSGSTPDTKLDNNAVLGDRVRLSFDATDLIPNLNDQLRIRLQAGNISSFKDATGTNQSRLRYDTPNGDNSFVLERLRYRFSPDKDKRLTIYLEAKGGDVETLDLLTPFVDKPTAKTVLSGAGALSRFGAFSPIYRIDSGTATGIVADYKWSDQISTSIAYIARNADNPKNGLFNGSYGSLARLKFSPKENLDLGFTYTNTYGIPVAGNTGSNFANDPFNNQGATSANSYGVEALWRVSPKFTASGWFDYTQAVSEVTREKANVQNWAIALGLPDLGKKGALGGFVFGQPPKVVENDLSSRKDRGTSYHLEAFYRYPVTDHLQITPGFFMVLNPENNNSNSTTFVWALRTRLTF